jgi:deazaflavin-dependent oxidoreductase (nitroreductase family)
MPIPKWVAVMNRRFLNPRELKRGVRPVLTNVGRSSGKTYRTPLDAHRVDGGFIFIVLYGPDSDWVQNVLASGTASVAIDGAEFDLISPRLISKQDASQLLAETTKAPADFWKVSDYLHMDTVAS